MIEKKNKEDYTTPEMNIKTAKALKREIIKNDPEHHSDLNGGKKNKIPETPRYSRREQRKVLITTFATWC